MNTKIEVLNLQIVTVSPEGRLDAGSAPALREKLDEILNEGINRIIIDLSEVLFLDSAGMAALVHVMKKARQNGGDVKLVMPKLEAAKRILRLTRFDRVFEVIESTEAVKLRF